MAAAVDCPSKVIDKLEPATLTELMSGVDAIAAGMRTANPTDDPRILLTRGEDIPSIIRENSVNPLGFAGALAGIYVGDYGTSGRHDVMVLPDDDRVLCLLVPGLELFLSDDATHHYDSVYSVDYAAGTVTLLDPWARNSFLLAGHNLAGVEATVTERDGLQPLLTLKLPELRQVLRGMVQWYFAPQTFEAMEALYPEETGKPDYLSWKFGVLLGSGSIDAGAFVLGEIDPLAKEHGDADLSALARATADLYPGLMNGFADQPGGEAAFRADMPALAAALPFTVRWLIGHRLDEFGPPDLAVAFGRANLDAHPDDIDMRIGLAGALLDAGDPDGASTELAAARRQWRADVKALIKADSEDEAIAYFLPHDKDTIAFRLFELRHERLLIEEARLGFLKSQDRAGLEAVIAYGSETRNGNFLPAFGEELLALTRLAGTSEEEAEVLAGLAVLPPGQQQDKAVESVFAHYTRTADIGSAAVLGQTLAGAPAFATRTCDIGRDGTAFAGQNEEYRRSWDQFCMAFPDPPSNQGSP